MTAQQAMETTLHRGEDATFQRWCSELESLEAFRLHERSKASRRGNFAAFRIQDARVAGACAVLAPLVRGTLADPALAVIKGMRRYASTKEWEAELFANAREALRQPYYDVDRATGPEPCRASDATRDFTLEEKLLMLETLSSLCDGWMGPGWCAQRLAAPLHIEGSLPTKGRPR